MTVRSHKICFEGDRIWHASSTMIEQQHDIMLLLLRPEAPVVEHLQRVAWQTQTRQQQPEGSAHLRAQANRAPPVAAPHRPHRCPA